MRWLALPLAALIKASMSFVEINRRRLRLDRHGSSGAPRPAGGLSPQVGAGHGDFAGALYAMTCRGSE
jgi:hypothetical protein